MKKFFEEFKKFITRGNVVDMAVGVIVGSSFTAIVNALSNGILKSLINWVLTLVFKQEDPFKALNTILYPVYQTQTITDEAGNVIETIVLPELDMAQTIYLDWGTLISAAINFILIAFVLFIIVKVINKLREENTEFKTNAAKRKLTKEQRAELKANGIKCHNKKAVAAYFAEKQRLADEQAAAEAAAAAAAAEAAAKAEREANPTTEDLLKLILAELKKN